MDKPTGGVASSVMRRHTVLILVLLGAVAVAAWDPVPLPQLLQWGEQFSANPWVIAAIIVLQALLFALALPGTAILFLVAPFHPLLISVAVLLSGSVLGALAAYYLASYLGESWRPRRGAWLIELLRNRSDFYTQCGLRMLPGCPHWAVNYGAGIIRVPLPPFITAAVLGLGIKWTLYSWVIQDASSAAQAGEGFDLKNLWPLLVLATLLIIGGIVRRRMIIKSKPPH
jgi:uncharacterized membrane protein YdjX (TVP38/TMEM64 family)